MEKIVNFVTVYLNISDDKVPIQNEQQKRHKI
jgi:septum formation topological specificity factor MinE